MRGRPENNGSLWYSINVEDLIEAGHPLRAMKRMVDEPLHEMSDAFSAAYATNGRPGVPPERLLKALLLQCLYSIRSERELCRRLKTDLLFQWFLDMRPDDETFDPTVFTKNRDRLAEHGLIARFFDGVVKQAKDAGLTSDDHFTVDGSLIQSHASLKSLKRIESEALARENAKPDDDDPMTPPSGGAPSGGAPRKRSRNESVDFRGERRGNATHRSTTDPDARLARKGSNVGAFLCHSVHALTENRHGLVLAIAVAEANGRAERECALEMVDRVRQQHHVRVATLGADMGYDSGDFLVELKQRKITAHVAIRSGAIVATDAAGRARSAARARQQHKAYATSQRRRKIVEEFFGWGKTISTMRRSKHIERFKIRQQAQLTAATYNLVRMCRLLAA